MRSSARNVFLIITWFSLVALACNLTSQDRPPTVVPGGIIAPPPQSTLGYATEIPGALPDAVQVGQQPQQHQIDVEMYSLMNQVQSDRLMMHVEALVSFHTRHVNSSTTSPDQGVGAAFNYLLRQFQAIQAQTPENFAVFQEGHPFPVTWNGVTSTQRNVVAYLQGWEAGAGIIVVGAHYDSRNEDQNDATGFAPGADDNASGVAAVIEIARILSRKPPRASILFVLFSAEEVGRLGSKAFVRDYIMQHNISRDELVMINLDSIGSVNDSRGNINDTHIRVFSPGPNNSASRQLARSIEFIRSNHSLPLIIEMQDGLDREGRYGDHESFTEAGYPAVRFINALEDSRKANNARDTIDGVSPGYLVKSTQTVLGVILALSDGPRPPRNMALRDNGNGMKALIWEPVPDAISYVVGLRSRDSLRVWPYFAVNEARTAEWDGWAAYEAVYIAAVDSMGLVGPFSYEYQIP